MRVLESAYCTNGLHITKPKFYLDDGGYQCSKYAIVPCEGVRYHPREFPLPPVNKEELFNRRHSQLRRTVERTFGVWKRRWAILRKRGGPDYSFDKQIKIVEVLGGLHNFIMSRRGFNWLHKRFLEDFEKHPSQEEIFDRTQERREIEASQTHLRLPDKAFMENTRDLIAHRMWEDWNAVPR